MRETLTTLTTAAQNYVANDTSSAAKTFLQNELNRAKTWIYGDMGDFVTQQTQTALSVNAQQFYHLPVNAKSIESVTYLIGSWTYTLDSTDSQIFWDRLNPLPAPAPSIPTKYLERKRDFGIWPIPQEDGDVITLTYQILDKNMQYDDVSGTCQVANNSQTVVGSATSFDQTYVGRWFTVTSDGFDYKISKVTDTTHLTLETAFEGIDNGTASFTIGDSPDLPEELLTLIPMRAAAMYYSGFRKDFAAGSYWINYFNTGDPKITATQVISGGIEPPGGYLSVKNTYASRTTDLVIRRQGQVANQGPFDNIWSTKVTF